MILYFIRHGDPIYEPDSLTALGHLQANALAKRLSRYGIEKIYSSSSVRARQTAEPTCELLRKKMEILDWCNEDYVWEEFAYTDGDGKNSWIFEKPKALKLLASDEIRKLGSEWYKHPSFANGNFENGINRIQKESDALLSSLGYKHNHVNNTYTCTQKNDKRIVLFAHHGFGLIFLSCLLDIPYPMFCTHFVISHSGMTVIEFPSKDGEIIPAVLQLNNDSHIYSEGLPTKYNNRIYL